MDDHSTQCRLTCRDCRPDNPDTWCDGCTQAEAADREANMHRWQARARYENLQRWTARFTAQTEDAL